MESKSKLVIDTSLLVRSFISPGSYSAKLIQSWYEDKFTLLLSQEIYDEVVDVLYRPQFVKYHFHKDRIETLLTTMISKCTFIEPYPLGQKHPFRLQSRDAKDTKFLHAALAGVADFLVSGDNDLLILKDHAQIGNLKIVTAEEILAIL